VELTDAGRIFVQEARSALFRAERAIHLARAAHEGSDSVLMMAIRPMQIRKYAPPRLPAKQMELPLPA
jgi:DNA-binding transcriptional LysR family regulator